MTLDFSKPITNIGGDSYKENKPLHFGDFVLGNSSTPSPGWQDVTVSGENKVNLINAKADGLNYVKAYGACTQTGTGNPSPSNIMPIICNNGEIKVSPNIYDITTNPIEQGTITGGVDAGSLYRVRTDTQINVLPSTNYTISSNIDFTYVWFFNADLTEYSTSGWISGTSTFTTPANAASIRVVLANTQSGSGSGARTITPDEVQYLQIEKGTTATPYRPYGQIYTDGTTETIGVNYFNINTMLVENEYVKATEGTSSNPMGKTTADSSYSRTDWISVSPNTEYTTIVPEYYNASSAGLVFYASNTVGSAISGVPLKNQGSATYTFTTPANCKYIRFCWKNNNGNDAKLIKTGNTATCQNLLAASSGTYTDVQSILDGTVTRNITSYVFTGNETWTQTDITNVYYTTDVPHVNGASYPSTCLCTHFRGRASTLAAANMSNGDIKAGGGSSTHKNKTYIKYGFSSVEDIPTFMKQQLASGTPVIMVNRKASTTESTTPQTLTTQKGNNVVEITAASIDPLEIEVSYKAGVSVTIEEVENANLDNNVTVTIGV